jgi:nitroimidazol reductase NimA-like FMN-containing flavoprotein (pyridoxamine 5'-phosphate oxidase superfamily)
MASMPDEAAALVSGAEVMAHLATSVDDRPHVAPVWYLYDDGVLELTTTGRKLANVRENPRVALSLQKDVEGDTQWTVTVLGTAEVIDDDEQFRAVNRRINEKYGVDPDEHDDNTLVRVEAGSASYRTY